MLVYQLKKKIRKFNGIFIFYLYPGIFFQFQETELKAQTQKSLIFFNLM